jgi:glycosidase
VFEVSAVTNTPVPQGVRVCLDTTLNAPATGERISIPFERVDDRTFVCRITPEQPGFFEFRARVSADGGRTWISDAVPLAWVMVDPPQIDGLRLYTLIPTVSGTIADWTAELQRIRDMGFNAVHLLPVTCLDDSQSPYAAKELFDVDHAYLMNGIRRDGLDQIEGFVQRAKDLGLALCFDLVLNHVGANSAMARRAPAWIVPDQDSPDGNKRARYWFEGQWRTWEDLVLVNYEHPSPPARAEVWEYMTRYALFWAKYASYTGGLVRFDNLHSSNSEFIKAVAARLSQEYPSLGVLAEYFTDDVTLLNTVPEWGLNLVLAMPWNYRFVPELRRYLRYIHRLSEHIRYFTPITSHDSGSPAQEFGTAESTVPRYIASALLGTGSTGMPQGVEWGVREKTNFIGVKAREAQSGQPRFGPLIRSVNELLAGNAAFRSGGNCQFVDHDHDSIIAAFRRHPDQSAGGFLVACNFDIHRPQRVECDLANMLGGTGPVEGRERLRGRQHRFDSAVVALELPPCGGAVWELARA